jgi:hypothetical protein
MLTTVVNISVIGARDTNLEWGPALIARRLTFAPNCLQLVSEPGVCPAHSLLAYRLGGANRSS